MTNILTNKALKDFGGFVRYFDTTEPLPQLAALVSAVRCHDVLVCCGGGDQALTMLGASQHIQNLWAVDINPAQIFVLAAKADFLKRYHRMPSFVQLQRSHPGRIAALKTNTRPLKQMQLRHAGTGKIFDTPDKLAERYELITGGGMFVALKSGPYWQGDKSFIARVRSRLRYLRFFKMDIFDSPDHFKKRSLDVIYLSDIYWSEALPYFQAKLSKMTGLLRPGGRIISYLDPGDDYMGQGISPGRVLAQQARDLALKIETDQDGGYLVLEKLKRK